MSVSLIEKVSIIVPVYNCDKYIEKCVYSLTNQKYSNIEIIIVDDGSTDNSRDIISRVSKKDSRIKTVFQNNMGVASARNNAMKISTGDAFLFVDADDYVGIDYVSSLVLAANENNSDLVVCGYSLVYEKDGGIKKIIPKSYCSGVHEEWVYRISAVCSRLYRRSFFEQYEISFFQEPEARAEDVPIAMFANLMASNITIINEAEYYYLQRTGSAMHSKGNIVFQFPFKAFSWIYSIIRNVPNYTNSKMFFDIGVIKFLAQFYLVLFRKMPKEERINFENRVKEIVDFDFKEIKAIWKKVRWRIEFPLAHKVAIDVFLNRICNS